tara:strand:+ start:1309 stop:1695 length:387 start_codon:yes stop_codon:yes gene_type:complete
MSLVQCDKVYVKDTGDERGMGSFAGVNISSGDVIERGLARRVDTDGNTNNYLFTWSEDRTIWAFCSGCATFYNTSLEPNTRMDRDFENDTFVIYAIKDIKKDEELTHKYRSLSWRMCFKELNNSLEKS